MPIVAGSCSAVATPRRRRRGDLGSREPPAARDEPGRLVVGEHPRADDGVVEAARRELAVGLRLGAQVLAEGVAALGGRVVGADRADDHVSIDRRLVSPPRSASPRRRSRPSTCAPLPSRGRRRRRRRSRRRPRSRGRASSSASRSKTTGSAPAARTSSAWSGVADQRPGLVAARDQQRMEEHRDLAVPAGDRDDHQTATAGAPSAPSPQGVSDALGALRGQHRRVAAVFARAARRGCRTRSPGHHPGPRSGRRRGPWRGGGRSRSSCDRARARRAPPARRARCACRARSSPRRGSAPAGFAGPRGRSRSAASRRPRSDSRARRRSCRSPPAGPSIRSWICAARAASSISSSRRVRAGRSAGCRAIEAWKR